MLKNAKIGVKLAAGFSLLIATVVIVTIVATVAFYDIRDRVKQSFDREFPKVVFIEDIITYQNEINTWFYRIYAVTHDEKRVTTYTDGVNKAISDIGDRVDSLKELLNPGEETKLYEDFAQARVKYRENLQEMLRLLAARDWDNYIIYLRDNYMYAGEEYSESINILEKFLINDMNEVGDRVEALVTRSMLTMLTVVGFGLLVAIIFAVFITRMITQPLSKCVDVANNISNGNTSVDIVVDSRDETGILSQAMQSMVDSIKRMYADAHFLATEARLGKVESRADVSKHKGDFGDIIKGMNETLDAVSAPLYEGLKVLEAMANKNLTMRMKGNYNGKFDAFKNDVNLAVTNLEDALSQVDVAVEQISLASQEITSGSQKLAETTSEQASSIEEISASLTEINSLTAGNADNAKASLKLADVAVKAVDEGNVAMEKMNHAMESILKSSEETSKIIKTIDEIAFQTNLLALNAAVEAAHAGDAGKGFAVVAEEVKNLALRSAEAANNTNELIEEAGQNSTVGSQIVEQVTKSFVEIKEQFGKVKMIVTEISASSDEQSKGVDQISTGVNEMSRVTQQNASNAEESAAAAEQLSGQAAELRSMVNTFTITKKA